MKREINLAIEEKVIKKLRDESIKTGFTINRVVEELIKAYTEEGDDLIKDIINIRLEKEIKQ